MLTGKIATAPVVGAGHDATVEFDIRVSAAEPAKSGIRAAPGPCYVKVGEVVHVLTDRPTFSRRSPYGLTDTVKVSRSVVGDSTVGDHTRIRIVKHERGLAPGVGG